MKTNFNFMKVIKVSLLLSLAFLNSNAQVNNNFLQTLPNPGNAAVGINFPTGATIPGPSVAQPQLNIYASNSNPGAGGESFLECRQAVPSALGKGDYFDITNSSGSSAFFSPKITGHTFSHSGPALYLAGDIDPLQDINTTPVIMYHVSKGGSRLTTLGNPITVRPLYGWTNNGAMQMMMDAVGNLGIGTGTGAITARLHTNGTVRHENLPSGQGKILVIAPNGDVFNSNTTLAQLQGSKNSCTSLSIVPKVTNVNGDMGCSQIFDDGSSVGIHKTSGFTYTSGTGAVFTAGAPLTQTVRLDVDGLTRSTTFAATSDGKYKTNVTVLKNSLDNIMKLNGVEYNWKSKEYPGKQFDNLKHSGFIAQELMKVLPNAVIKDGVGDYAVDYNSIIPVLAEAIKEQQAQIEELKKLLSEQSSKSLGDTNFANTSELVDGHLDQNVPNPFSNNTEIKYQLPKTTQTAMLAIYDLNGKQLKIYSIDAKNNSGSIMVRADELQAGMYIYTLIINGKAFDSKKMILTSH